jgi:hypothetical protein
MGDAERLEEIRAHSERCSVHDRHPDDVSAVDDLLRIIDEQREALDTAADLLQEPADAVLQRQRDCLRAENARLREALEGLRAACLDLGWPEEHSRIQAARAVLEEVRDAAWAAEVRTRPGAGARRRPTRGGRRE